jgi:hypothetical protein
MQFSLTQLLSRGRSLALTVVLLQHKTIESVLERGEKLDNLVDRSNALSAQSKMFYKTAKKVRHISIQSTTPVVLRFLSIQF